MPARSPRGDPSPGAHHPVPRAARTARAGAVPVARRAANHDRATFRETQHADAKLSISAVEILDRAKQLIISEVATVRGQNEKNVEDQVDRALAAAYQRSVKASA